METINGNNQENNNMQVLNQIIQQIFGKYELFEGYYILEGVDLVGIKNFDFWINIVKQISETKGLDNLPHYISLMQKMDRNYLRESIGKLENNDLDSFENLIFGLDYIDLVRKSL